MALFTCIALSKQLMQRLFSHLFLLKLLLFLSKNLLIIKVNVPRLFVAIIVNIVIKLFHCVWFDVDLMLLLLMCASNI